jgi:hypothetical protein
MRLCLVMSRPDEIMDWDSAQIDSVERLGGHGVSGFALVDISIRK